MVLWGKGRELEKAMSAGGKSIEEREEAASIGLPVYLSPSREPTGVQK